MFVRPATLLVLPTATTTEKVVAVSAVFVNVPEKDQTPAGSAVQTTSVRASFAMAVGLADADSMLVSRVASTLGPGSGGAVAGRSAPVTAGPGVAAASGDPGMESGAVAETAADGSDADGAGVSAGGEVQPERAMTPVAAHQTSGLKLRIVPLFPRLIFSFGNQRFLTGKTVQTEIISGIPSGGVLFDRNSAALSEKWRHP